MKRIVVLCAAMVLLVVVWGCGSDEPVAEQGAEMSTTEAVGGPFSGAELDRFLEAMDELPMLRGQGATTGMGEALKAKLDDLDWDQTRFMYIYSHVGAMMSFERMRTMTDQMAGQMMGGSGMEGEQADQMKAMLADQIKQQVAEAQQSIDAEVPASEQELIRERLPEVMKAFGMDR